MSSADLQAWANNFAVLRGSLDNYESEAQQINPFSPNKGVGQMIAFQYGTSLKMLDLSPLVAKPAWLEAEDFGPTDGREHLLLGSRYVLEATMQHADSVPLDTARTTLRNSLKRLEDIATRWAANGVDATELEQIVTERRDLARRAQAAAANLNQ
ncbi:hypothetical protein FHY52_07810 [Nocardia nova]|uniref:hypothetical protein n=1 Tax=Nocardia nova TaxID=37330 RepID=UPI0025B005F8|nr:hypothetical protein [Nocardia nova]MDN2496599.1 hypothetical protein [Nocardia nova]